MRRSYSTPTSPRATERAFVPESCADRLETALQRSRYRRVPRSSAVPIINDRTKLSSPAATDDRRRPTRLTASDNIVTRRQAGRPGRHRRERDLPQRQGAEELDARPGDTVTIFVQNAPTPSR
jgi:hypothetical protein